ncbi:transposase [bacterium]|nr:transposase [bacterium]
MAFDEHGHRGLYNHGRLPHFDHHSLFQAITFRLADSLHPSRFVANPSWKNRRDDTRAIFAGDEELDTCYGNCWLKDHRIASIVEDSLLHFDGERYLLLAWVIMPNHVHVMIAQRKGFPLAGIIRGWKSFTATQSNRILGRTGSFWQRDYFDRFIRDQRHLHNVADYIHQNPVKAKLCRSAAEWKWSSYNRISERLDQ